MLNDFELNNVHAESAEKEKWSILSINMDSVEYNRKTFPLNRVECQKSCRQIQSESRTCQVINCDNVRQQLQEDY